MKKWLIFNFLRVWLINLKDILGMIICILPFKQKILQLKNIILNENKRILNEIDLFASVSGMIYSVFGSVGISMQINSTFSNILKLIAFIDCFTVCQHGNCSWTCNVYGRLIGPKAILIKYKCVGDFEIFFIKKKISLYTQILFAVTLW